MLLHLEITLKGTVIEENKLANTYFADMRFVGLHSWVRIILGGTVCFWQNFQTFLLFQDGEVVVFGIFKSSGFLALDICFSR